MADKQIIDYFSPVFSFGLDIENNLAETQGHASENCTDVCETLQTLIDNVTEKALKAGKQEQDIQESKFAIIAWLDEIFARYPEWSTGYTPLQVSNFATNNAGNEFFEHLNDLKKEQGETREVYYTALCLGFSGEHSLQGESPVEIERLKEQQALQLPRKIINSSNLHNDHVTQQPYLVKDPPKPKHKKSWWPYIIYSLLAIGIIGSLIYYYLSLGPSRARIIAEMNNIFDLYQCADLKGELSEDYVLNISGFVGKPNEQTKLVEQLKEIKGVEGVDSRVQAYKWPLCEMILILKDHTIPSSGKEGEPRVRPLGQSLTYQEGEKLTIEVTAPDYDSYVYVDYIQKDGAVIHMLPNEVMNDNALLPGKNIKLGVDKTGLPIFVVRPPFGLDMVAIYTSPIPLFNKTRESIETAETYFSNLKSALIRLREKGYTEEIRSDYFLISTVKRR